MLLIGEPIASTSGREFLPCPPAAPAVKWWHCSLLPKTARQVPQLWETSSRAGQQSCCWKQARRRFRCKAVAASPFPAGIATPQKQSWLQQIWAALVNQFPSLGSPEVRKRALGTLGVLLLARVGAFIPLYGVEMSKLPPSFLQMSEAQMVTGTLASIPANIFMLGLGPLFSASIVVGVAYSFPQLLKIQRKPGREGAAQARVWSRCLTALFAVIAGTVEAFKLREYASYDQGFIRDTMLTLVGGCMVLTHLSEEHDSVGLGSGTTLLIAISILLRQSQTLAAAFALLRSGAMAWWQAGAAAVAIFALVAVAIFVSLTEKRYDLVSHKIDVQHEREEHRRPRENSNYLPMRISPSGVGSLLMSTLYINLATQLVSFLHRGLGNQLMRILYRPTALPLAVAVVSFLNVAVDWSGGRTVKDVSLWMQKADVGVKHDPALVPGAPTARYLIRQQALAHFWGGLGVAALACAGHALDAACRHFAGMPFGAVNMLLLTGFITTAYRQVSALSEMPKLERRLEREQCLLQSITE